MPEEPSPCVYLVVVAQENYANWGPLTQARKAAEELTEVLRDRGYVLVLPELIGGGTKDEVERS